MSSAEIVTRTEIVIKPVEVEINEVVLTLSVQDALNILAVCGVIGGSPSTGRATFSEHEGNIGVAIKNALGLDRSYARLDSDVSQGTIMFNRNATVADFTEGDL